MDFDIVLDFDFMIDLDSFGLQNHGNHFISIIKV